MIMSYVFVSANRLFVLAGVKSFNGSMFVYWNGNLKGMEVMTEAL